MSRDDEIRFNPDAALPFTFTRACALVASIGVYWLILHVYWAHARQDLSDGQRLRVAATVIAAIELSINNIKFKSVPVLVRIYWLLTRIPERLRFRLVRVSTSALRFLFYVISTSVLIFVLGRIRTDWRTPTTQPEVARDLVVAGLTLVAGIVALFFTVLGLALQRTMEDYSPSFARIIIRKRMYLWFLGESFFITGLDIWILVRGVNPGLLMASAAGSFYSILSIPFLVAETFHDLDISHVIRQIAEIAVTIAKRKIKPQPPILTAKRVEPGEYVLPWRRSIHMAWQKWVTGSMAVGAAFPLFDVADEIVEELKDDVRAITNTTLKAIALDRREVVLSCLRSMARIVDGYAAARSTYEGKSDAFLLFMSDQVQITLNASLKSPNEQYPSDVTDCVGDFAVSCLKLTLRPEGRYAENGHVGMYCNVLADIAIRSFKLQHSDAAPKACEYIGKIGQALIVEEAYETVLFGIVEKIKKVGLYVASQPGPWAAFVCQKCLGRLTLLINAALQQTIKSGHHYSPAVKMVLEHASSILAEWYEQNHGHMDNQAVIGPLVGSLWMDTKWTTLAANALRGNRSDTEALGVIEDLSELTETVGALACAAIKKKRSPHYEYFLALSEIVYEEIEYYAKCAEDPHLGNAAYRLVVTGCHAALRMLEVSCTSGDGSESEDFYNLSPIWAFLIDKYKYLSKNEFAKIYAEATAGVLEIAKKLASQRAQKKHEFRTVCKYLKLFGAWLYRYDPRNPANKKIILFLAQNYEYQVPPPRLSSSSPMEDLGYPVEHIAQAWYIHPSQHWGDKGIALTRELNDLANYQIYHRAIRKLAQRLGTFVSTRVVSSSGL